VNKLMPLKMAKVLQKLARQSTDSPMREDITSQKPMNNKPIMGKKQHRQVRPTKR